MAFAFHHDKDEYFKQQKDNAAEFIHPFVEQFVKIDSNLKVLEIGCAEGGVLCSFLEKGAKGVGIELLQARLDLANHYLSAQIPSEQFTLINKNIYDINPAEDLPFLFDLVILKDVIEHIPHQEKVLAEMTKLLAPGGKIFFGFPPWQMPFGGHQQICESKILHLLPYFHLLPRFMYKAVLKMFGEKDSTIEELMDIKSTGISLERFERICKENDYKIVNKKLYLINPIYKYKFKLTPRKQFGFISAIPYIRNYFTTCGYYLIEKK
jgi:2-polyprenyl-3-methyl-5-hydroxy-6-metoxy-1,4-benzoquinol methylase